MFLFSKIYFISVYAIIKIENTNIFVALYTKILVIRHTRRRRRTGARKIKCYTRLRCYIHVSLVYQSVYNVMSTKCIFIKSMLPNSFLSFLKYCVITSLHFDKSVSNLIDANKEHDLTPELQSLLKREIYLSSAVNFR